MIVLIAAWSCKHTPDPGDGTKPTDDSGTRDTTPTDTTPVDTTTTQGELSGSCTADPVNVLRASCAFDRSPAGPVEVEVTDGAETVVFTDPADATAHEIPLWGFYPATEWTWTARAGGDEVTGTFSTGNVPAPVRIDFHAQADGTPSTAMVLMPVSCDVDGYMVAADFDGRVRWYQDFLDPEATADARIMASQLGDDDVISALAGTADLARIDLAGREVLRLTPGPPVHHDVFHRDGVTWLFQAEDYTDAAGRLWVEDVVAGYDDGGNLVYSWAEHDHLDTADAPQGPSGFWDDEYPGSTDAWHSNGLYVTDGGDIVVSLNRIRTILRIDPAGDTVWTLTGDGIGHPWPSDFTPVDGAGPAKFLDAHHPALLDDGTLTVFDNSGPRGLELALDAVAGTMTFAGEYPLSGVNCPIQGSHFILDDGHHLVTCATDHLVTEFDDAGAQVARMDPSCPSGDDPPYTVRGQPVDLWDAAVGTVRARRP